MTGNDHRGMQMIGQASGYPYPRPEPTIDEAIKRLRGRAEELRRNLGSVDAWRKELERLEATLAAWGDK